MSRDVGCVVMDGRLIGFLGMPVEPFVWIGLESLNEAQLRSVESAPEVLDYLVSPPEMRFSAGSPELVFAVSEELLQLFDKYGIPFTAGMSELLSYEPAMQLNAGELFAYEYATGQIMESRVRNFRLLGVEERQIVMREFVRLVDTWLEIHAQLQSEVQANVNELTLLRGMVMEFSQVTGDQTMQSLGWGWQRKMLVMSMLTPFKVRSEWSRSQLERSEAMVAASGYKNLW